MDNWFEILVDTLKNEQLMLLLHYGSTVTKNDSFRDVDIFAVCGTDKKIRTVKFGLIDLKIINCHEFHHYYSNLDPIFCTEPIITGRVIYTSCELCTFSQILHEREPTPDIVKYLFRESIHNYIGAIDSLKLNNLYTSFTMLNHSLTYLLFSQWYKSGNRPAALGHLLKHAKSVEIKRHFENRSAMKNELNEQKIQFCIELWENALTSGLSLF